MNAELAKAVHLEAFTCRLCGYVHQPVKLRVRERAICSRCGVVLVRANRYGVDGGLAFTVTGLILAVPAMFLPFVTAGKLGNQRVNVLFAGVDGLWENDMRLLAVWVFLCSALLPITLLGVLAALLLPERFGWGQAHTGVLARAALAMEHWAMPEVQVLAVLVALMKLGRLADVTIGPGFWCYVGMSFALLMAWRSVDLETLVAATGERRLTEGGS